MDNIYHQYWQQELMYQLASADRCRKRAYICSNHNPARWAEDEYFISPGIHPPAPG